MRYFPFGLLWSLARVLVGERRYRAHLHKLATVHLVIGPCAVWYTDGYGQPA